MPALGSRMSPIFGYYDDWKTPVRECPTCGWRGTFEEGSIEWFRELMTSSFPTCLEGYSLAIVSYPSDEETEANLDRLSESERADFQCRKARLGRWERESLKSPDELPELQGDEITLTWELVEHDDEKYTVIRAGNVEVWRELVLFEGSPRFVEILAMLQARYGERLLDVVASAASDTYLYGDRLRAIDEVEGARRRLRKPHS